MEDKDIAKALSALGASLELAIPVVVLALLGYYAGRKYGDLGALAGMIIGMALGFVIGVRELIEKYGKK